MGVPGIDFPGNWRNNMEVLEFIENLTVTELPNGLYTFWVEFYFGEVSRNNVVSYKTYINVTDSGTEVFSDEIPLFWGEVFSSTGIMVACIVFVTFLQKLKFKKKVKINRLEEMG